MTKIEQYAFKGMNQDLSKSKHPNEFYYEGNNIRIISTTHESTGSISNEKGNELFLPIPSPTINPVNISVDYLDKTINYKYNTTVQPRCELEEQYFISNNVYKTSGTQYILDGIFTRKGLIIFSTDNNGFDCIWLLNTNTQELELKYLRNLGFNIANNFTILNNFENDIIDKIYWIDGVNQLRFLNLEMSLDNGDDLNLIDLKSSSLSQVSEFKINQPIINSINKGGNHTSGMIQYAYNLYSKNGSQSILSPFSDLVALDKFELGGGLINEVVGSTPVIEINDIDTNFTNIKIYAIKYTSYNESPSISLIKDAFIPDTKNIIYYDDGTIIESVSIEEFTFLGSDIIIPYNFNSKYNRLIIAGYEEKVFDINTKNSDNAIDLRAFSFPENNTTVEIYDSLKLNDSDIIVSDTPGITINNDVINGNTKIDYKFSCINKDLRINNFQYNSNIRGGEGKYIKYELKRENNVTDLQSKNKFFKDNELYRIAIQFYNKFGHTSQPKWIADFIYVLDKSQSPGNLGGEYSCLEVTLKPEFYVWLNNNNNFLNINNQYDDSLKPVGYKILRAERKLNDKTIICQGILNPTISQSAPNSINLVIDSKVWNTAENGIKMPSLMRNYYKRTVPFITNYASIESSFPVRSVRHAYRLDDSVAQPNTYGPYNEIYAHNQWANQRSTITQNSKLLQLFSPEILFDTINYNSIINFKPTTILKNSSNNLWIQKRGVITQAVTYESKTDNLFINGSLGGNSAFMGLIGPSGESDNGGNMIFKQLNREYISEALPNDINFKIRNTPFLVEKGQGRTSYNNDSRFAFYNSWLPLLTDVNSDGEGLIAVNSWGAKNITLLFGQGTWYGAGTNPNVDPDLQDVMTIEELMSKSGMDNTIEGHNAIMGDFTINENLIYVGNLYGGNGYENKLRSNYLEIGNYKSISQNINYIINGGDTFVGKFKFAKLTKTDTEVYNSNWAQFTEIVEFPVETSIDIYNRSDLSLSEWDAKFQPKYDEFHNYNKIYSQEPNLLLRRGENYNFKKVTKFNNKIISSKLKVAGELIDSWTDILVNETLDIDGKYGNINHLYSFKDDLYVFQDKAISMLNINPRIQLQSTDGVAIELGKGDVLYDYKYLTTTTGTLNKKSIINSKTGIYYYDTINKTINYIQSNSLPVILSSLKGMHVPLTNKTINDELIKNKPLLLTGVTSGYDNINEDLIFTFLQNHDDDKSFTLSYNEKSQSFVSFYDYKSPLYLNNLNEFYSINPLDLNKLYKHHAGEYNKFYDNYYKSYITLKINPDTHLDCIFDNIQFNSEVNINDLDIPNETLTAIRAWNEYQDSDVIPLVVGNNIKRKFRTWRAFIPRNKNTRERIRNPWIYLKLEFDNTTNKRLVLHDILVLYTV